MDSLPADSTLAAGIQSLHIVNNDQLLDPWSDTPLPPSPQQGNSVGGDVDGDGDKSSADDRSHVLRTPDPAALDEVVVGGLEADAASSEPTIRPPPLQDVLNEFDPLADQEEKEARQAWENTEAHPPRLQTPSPPPSTPAKDPVPESSHPTATSSSSFTSLAAFARSFSIPTLPRVRPVSMDVARPVPSPATLSSFAAQQQEPPKPSSDDDAVETKVRSATPSGNARGSESPKPGGIGELRKDIAETPFDFQKFLDQMKTKSAEPIAKYLKSFLSNFAKRMFATSDQVKIINDFLTFISGQMRTTDIWKNASESEFDNAMEGMEKLVMNRLYDFTFMPQVARAIPPRPVTADDLERDRILTQRIALFGWIEEKHLDVPEGDGSNGFLMFAQQELLKINHYKAPRDKLICILNCCKVIFGLIRHLRKEESADAFVPILIFVVLKANPEHLLSNVEFINRFRNPVKLQSEAGYYLSSLMGAVSFIETMDHTSLSNITQEEFERNVEEAIQSLPPSEPESPMVTRSEPSTPKRNPTYLQSSPHAGEESAHPLSLSSPAQTLSEDARRLLQKTGDTISKPLNAIGRIFSEALDGAESKLINLPGPFGPLELGREQQRMEQAAYASRDGTPIRPGQGQRQYGLPLLSPGQDLQTPVGTNVPNSAPLQTPYKTRVRKGPSPSFSQSPGSPGYAPEDSPTRYGVYGPYTNQPLTIGPSQQQLLPPLDPRLQSLSRSGAEQQGSISRTPTPNLDIAGMQAAIDSAHEQVAAAARETLGQIFPGVDREVVEWVLEANQGDLGKSIEALLEMSSGT